MFVSYLEDIFFCHFTMLVFLEFRFFFQKIILADAKQAY